MRSSAITKTLAAASATKICTAQTLLAAGNYVIDGAAATTVAGVLVGLLDTQRRLRLTFAADETGHNFTILGLDERGNGLKWITAGTTAGTVDIPIDFMTVTSFSVDAVPTGAVSLGTNGIGSSPWKLVETDIATPNLSFEGILNSGAANYSVEYTYEPVMSSGIGATTPLALGSATVNPTAWALTSMEAKAASAEGAMNFVPRAWRLTINSGTGSVTLTGRQAGLASP